MSSHFQERCEKHDVVLRQCRCPNPLKDIRYVECPNDGSCGFSERLSQSMERHSHILKRLEAEDEQ